MRDYLDPGCRVVGRPALGLPAYADEGWPALLYRPGGSFVMLDYELSVRPTFAEICVDLPGAGHACCFAWRIHPFARTPRARLTTHNVGWVGRTRAACHPVIEDEAIRLGREGAPVTVGALAAGAFTDLEGYRLPDGGRIRVQWAEVVTPIETDLLVPAFIGPGPSWTDLADYLCVYGEYGGREYNEWRAEHEPVVVCPERAARLDWLGSCG